MPRILILAGEASGDLHGAKLAAALKSLSPDVELLGLGGDRMRAAGVELLEGIDRLDIIGLPSWPQLRQAIRTFRALSRRLQELELDAVVLIDNPGLNLRLARVAKQAGHRVIYYIAPQIWAWNQGRIKLIQRRVDRVLVILPFEEKFYRDAHVPCQFVGHPLLDEMPESFDRASLRAKLGLEPTARVIGLLPGSREREIRSLLPTMLDAARLIAIDHTRVFPSEVGTGSREENATRQEPRALSRSARSGQRSSGPAPVPVRVLLAQAQSLPSALIAEVLAGYPVPVQVVRDAPYDVMAASDMLFVASGTATLQSALTGTPMAIVYRASFLTSAFARAVVKTRWLGLANIVAGRQIAPEFLQSDFTPENLAAEARRVLSDPAIAEASAAAARDLRQSLGSPGASYRAAHAILAECGALPP